MRERADLHEELGSCRVYGQTRAYGRKQNTWGNRMYVNNDDQEGM